MYYYGTFFIYVYHIWFFYFKMGGDITESPHGKVDHLMGKVFYLSLEFEQYLSSYLGKKSQLANLTYCLKRFLVTLFFLMILTWLFQVILLFDLTMHLCTLRIM